MKRTIVIIMMLLSVLTGVAQAQSAQELEQKAAAVIARVQKDQCPDAREWIFDVKTELSDGRLILSGELHNSDVHKALMKALKSSGIEAKDELTVLPDSDSMENPFGVVRLSVCQVRAQDGNSHEMVSQSIMGAEVAILKTEGSWHRVQMEDRYLGWIKSSALAMGDKAFISKWRKAPKGIVQSLFCQARLEPLEDSDPLCDLIRGNKIILGDKSGEWVAVTLPDGRQGYLKSEHVLSQAVHSRTNRQRAELIIQTAKASLGLPYLWGGSSVKGFDCSGFMQSVYKFHGVQLRRDASMQAEQGMAVAVTDELEQLLPGDLLFFGSNPARITHVGMYIGNKKYIHASGMVKINSFDPEDADYNEYLHVRLRKVRRILDPSMTRE